MINLRLVLKTCLFLLFLAGCSNQGDISPRPRAYPRVIYPERHLTTYDQPDCPFTFSFPDYFTLMRDSTYFDEFIDNPCWFNLRSDQFNADVHCTYTSFSSYTQFQQLVQDAFKLANEQNKRASYIEDFKIILPNGTSGMAFNMEGPSASPFQFFLTDSVRHFFRGSLYFNSRPNPDSLRPVTEYDQEDLTGIIQSFSWR